MQFVIDMNKFFLTFVIPGIVHDLQLDSLSSEVIGDEVFSKKLFSMDPTCHQVVPKLQLLE